MEDFEEAGKTRDIMAIWRTKGPDANLATQICSVLKEGRRFAELEKFLAELPEATKYQTEEIIRSKIEIAWMRRNCELVYELIEENSFSNGEDLIEIWDKAHYFEEEQIQGRALTALAKFRIRQRFIPPSSICPSGVRKKNTLPKEAKQVLTAWLDKNFNDPFPNRNTKDSLAHQSGLTRAQVKTWFANARRRINKNRPKQAVRYKISDNRTSSAAPRIVTSKESSPTLREASLPPPSDLPEARSQQLSKAHCPNTPVSVLLPPLPTRLLGHGLGFPLPPPQVYAFEPAPQLMNSDACAVHCKVENGAAFVNQPFFPLALPEQFLLPRAPPPFPFVSVCKQEESQSCEINRQQLQPGSHVTDPSVHVAHRSSHVTYPAAHVTYFNPQIPFPNSQVTPASPPITYSSLHGLHPRDHVSHTDPYVRHQNPCVTYPSPHVTPTSSCVTLPSTHVFPPNGSAYAGLHAARVLMDMSNTFTK